MGTGVWKKRASLYLFGTLAAALLLLVLSTAGCNPTPQTAAWPQPNFSGPPQGVPLPPPTANLPTPNGVPREWLPAATPRQWTMIIIHHSATPTGGARKFDADHRARHFVDLGYDFVIGNGTETRDGQIEVGPRWREQRVGAHTQDTQTNQNRYNEHGIGICLVGNFDVTRPTPAQLQSLARLVAYLEKTYHVRPDRVVGHRDCKKTDCPGSNLSIAVVRRMASQALAETTPQIDPDTRLAGELLKPNIP